MEENSYLVEAQIEINKDTVDNEGLVSYTHILQRKEKLFISLKKVKLPIDMKSALKAMQMCNNTIEENILFAFYQPYTISKPKEAGKREASVIPDNQAKLLNHSIEINNSTSKSFRVPRTINDSIALTIKEHSFIGRHYALAKAAWYFIYIYFIIGALGLLVHLIILITNLKIIINVYILIICLLIVLLLSSGIYGLSLNHNSEKIPIKPLHYLGGLSALVTVSFFFFLNETVMKVALYNSMYPWRVCYYVWFCLLLVVEILMGIANYQMDKFYQKYQQKLLSSTLIIGDFGFTV